MTEHVSRRQFLNGSTAVLGGTVLGSVWSHGRPSQARPEKTTSLKKGACIGVFPKQLSVMDKFKLAQAAGFAGIEPNTIKDPDQLEQYKEAAKATGVKIHSIMNSDHWNFPLSDNNPEVVNKCIEGIKTSLRNAHELGADAILLVPAVVTADVRYIEAYERSQKHIRSLLPMARELKVVIAVENVGNRFLLSPLEFVRYIDEFKSPFVKGYFDIGNIVSSGYPQDWIRTFGDRLFKVHIKRFEPGTDYPKFDASDRRTQGINWPAVRQALRDVEYNGWVTAEVGSGDENYLRELSKRMDRIFAGENPY